ncbi:multidrug resistance efflux pump [Shewanella psychrophila]|uniref:Multidrug resistance efflux pump n=1 Tax=Shewanella psychrophila TaxID=225848 RepID=A0A1S6HRJ6_9GAMM|nr:HlyD family efflux transporter periplasmic adaptor subunit [Shewanella psychrophila]AQS38145.1 multidrug resistance efflux pump [Shewanella psychrophila]
MKVNYQATSKAEKPDVDNGVEVKYSGAKRAGFKFRWYLLLFLVISPVLLVSWILAKPYIFVLAPGIITAEPLEMRAPSKGTVQSVVEQDTGAVNKGGDLLVIADPELDAQVTELSRQLVEIEGRESFDGEQVLQRLRRRIEVAQNGVKRQDDLLVTYQNFQKRGVVPTSDMAMVLQANTASKMALEQAKVDLLHELERQHIQTIAGVIPQTRNQLRSQLAKLKSKQSGMKIIAPFTGRIEDTLVQVGEQVDENQPLLWLTGRDKPVVLAYLDPKYLEYVDIGQLATIKLPNGQNIRGKIEEPTELVTKIPKQLSGPFDGEKAALKVTLTLEETLPFTVEGVPVEISFDYKWPSQ